MPIEVGVSESKIRTQEIRRYHIRYPISAYTFPSDARIEGAWFDDEYLHVKLMDGRILSVPLSWIPTLRDAEPAQREKFEISRDRRWIIWDPDISGINEEIRIADYLGPAEEH